MAIPTFVIGILPGYATLGLFAPIALTLRPSRTLEINTSSMTLLVPLVIDAGALSDRLGRKPLLLLACGLGFIGAVPLFLLLNQHSARSPCWDSLGLC